MKTTLLAVVLFVSGCASNHAPDDKLSLNCPFGTVAWEDRDGAKCVPKYQMERAIRGVFR